MALSHVGLRPDGQVEHMDNERQLGDMSTEIEKLQAQLDSLRNEFTASVFWGRNFSFSALKTRRANSTRQVLIVKFHTNFYSYRMTS